ncbi:MAG: NAD(P)H-dependent oxidoreductase [Methanomassiliicoccus sp.]|nr:NAD(P)H-dependent oxidoreductase [Methanomassiliicoccus sp.]
MKVLAIMGSPRRNGTGTEVMKMIERRLRERGEVEMEVLHLADVGLQPCRGCFSCIKLGEDRCPFREEREALEKRIEAADGIILVSPGYVQNVSGLMKDFIDRMAYTNHRPRFFGKKVMIVANGGAGLDRTLDALRIAIGGPEVVSELAYLALPWPTRPRTGEKNEKALLRATDRFHDAMVRKDMRPSFGNYMRFRFFKSASEAAREWLPADHAYYHRLDGYYYDVKIGVGTRLMAAASMAIAMPLMRGMAPWSGEDRP